MDKICIEKSWMINGYHCLVMTNPMGYRCGYVGMSRDHPLYAIDYEHLDIECHGGLTFGNFINPELCTKLHPDFFTLNPTFFYIGFDCAHLHDGRDPELMSDDYKQILGDDAHSRHGITKSLAFCIRECEKIVVQLQKAIK